MLQDESQHDSVAPTIAPWLVVRRAAEAVAFYQAAFGAVARYRLEDEDGRIVVAQLAIGGADFWLQEDPDSADVSSNEPPIRMILTVNDPDTLYAQSIAAGATSVFPVTEDHGWRTGRLVDPFGHHWEISKPLG